MLDFVFIITIFLEIAVTSFLIFMLCKLEKKVQSINEELFLTRDIILEINSELKRIITNVNKVVSIFTNKKFIQISRVIMIAISTIQIIVLFRTLDFSKGLKSINFTTIKKILMTQLTKTFFQKIIGYLM